MDVRLQPHVHHRSLHHLACRCAGARGGAERGGRRGCVPGRAGLLQQLQACRPRSPHPPPPPASVSSVRAQCVCGMCTVWSAWGVHEELGGEEGADERRGGGVAGPGLVCPSGDCRRDCSACCKRDCQRQLQVSNPGCQFFQCAVCELTCCVARLGRASRCSAPADGGGRRRIRAGGDSYLRPRTFLIALNVVG